MTVYGLFILFHIVGEIVLEYKTKIVLALNKIVLEGKEGVRKEWEIKEERVRGKKERERKERNRKGKKGRKSSKPNL